MYSHYSFRRKEQDKAKKEQRHQNIKSETELDAMVEYILMIILFHVSNNCQYLPSLPLALASGVHDVLLDFFAYFPVTSDLINAIYCA